MERFRALLKVEGLEGGDGEHFNDRVLVDECGGFVLWFWVWVSVWRDFRLGFGRDADASRTGDFGGRR